jgi:hypothetical protein
MKSHTMNVGYIMHQLIVAIMKVASTALITDPLVPLPLAVVRAPNFSSVVGAPNCSSVVGAPNFSPVVGAPSSVVGGAPQTAKLLYENSIFSP